MTKRKTLSQSIPPLNDAIYELSISGDIPSIKGLDSLIRRFPEHSQTLTDFAILLAADSLHDEQQSQQVLRLKLSPAVSHAMNRFWDCLSSRTNKT